MSTYVSVEISPATTTRPVVISVSQATRPAGSSASTASSTVSEIWSATLSGWPSVTDSDVKRNSRTAIRRARLLDLEEDVEGSLVPGSGAPGEERSQRAQVLGHRRREIRAGDPGEALDQRDRVLQVDVDVASVRIRKAGRRLCLVEVRALRQLLRRVADLRDPARSARDHDLAVLRAVVDRELAEVDRALRPPLEGPAAGARDPGGQLVERREGRVRVLRLQQERDLRNHRAGPDVERRLVREQLDELVHRDPERVFERRLGAAQRGADALRRAEGEEGERVARHLADQLRGVIARTDEVAGTGALDGSERAEPVALGGQGGGDEVELFEPRRGGGQAAAASLAVLMDELRELWAVHVGLRERVRGQRPERVVVRRLVGERLVAGLERLVDLCLRVADHVPAVDLAVDLLLAGALGRVQLLDEVLELAGVVRLRQADHGHVLSGLGRDEREVDLGPERGLDVVLEVDAVLGELVVDLLQQQVAAGELLRQRVELLPLARAEIAVDRDERDRVRADERGARPTRAHIGRAAAARGEQRRGCEEAECERLELGHSRVGWRPIRLAASSCKSVPSSTLQTPSVIGSSIPNL